VISDELVIRLPGEFKKQLSKVYKNRPLIVRTIINALQVLYTDRNGISGNVIEQYSTLLIGLTTENVPQLKESLTHNELVLKVQQLKEQIAQSEQELLNHTLTTLKDNSGRPITTIKEKEGEKYDTINVDKEIHRDIQNTITCLSKDYKYVKTTKLLKVKNWLYRNFTPIQKQERDLLEVMSHQAKDSVLSREQYYSTINDDIRTKFRKDVTFKVLNKYNTNLRSMLDLIGEDNIPLETKKRWFKDDVVKHN
jgi:hypothetical protein